MAADPRDRDVVRARLDALRVVAGGPGWVPRAPEVAGGPVAAADVPGDAAQVPGAQVSDDAPVRDDAQVPDDAVPGGASARDDARVARRRALEAAVASYTAVHGHPLAAADLEPPRYRLATTARAAAAAVAALALVAAVVVWRAWPAAPAATTVPVPAAEPGDGDPLGPAGPEPVDVPVPADEVVVHVVGAVAVPGLVRLPEGSRVADAVEAAGGATADADLAAVNLARPLVDGEQVVVPVPGQVAADPPAADGAGGGAGGSGLVDLNRADVAALDELPGIGPVLAERIVEWREQHGRFTAVEELVEVSGIGPALLARVRDKVTVG